jgi:hypothetical protein
MALRRRVGTRNILLFQLLKNLCITMRALAWERIPGRSARSVATGIPKPELSSLYTSLFYTSK